MPSAPALLLMLLLAVPAHGQTRGATPCAPVPAGRGAAITFGHEGGTLRPRVVAISADGIIRAGADSATDSVATIPPPAVAALTRLARTGGFWTLSGAVVHRPPRNADAARAFIEVTMTCGSRRAEYVMGEPMSAAFSELLALLELIADAAGDTHK